MASKMYSVKLCLLWLFLQDKSILTHSRIIVYTVEGSTINIPFIKATSFEITVYFNRTKIYSGAYFGSVNTKKYDVELHSDFQMKNVLQSDTGYYWLDILSDATTQEMLELNITHTSCPSSEINYKCAIAGSSPILTFVSDWSVYHSKHLVNAFTRSSQRISNVTILVYFQIHNVTREDKGLYTLYVNYVSGQLIEVDITDLRFNNQTDLMTIDGEEGKELDINCTSVTGKFITALKLEVNGSIIETGDNRSVNYSFTPDRTDHLSKYKCLDITHSSIKIEVTLNIRFIDIVFIDQTDPNTIVGQEGKALVIKCTSVTRQFITTLELEVNGLIIAIGDNQSVIYSFTPDRTDHLTKYKCIDSKQSWIMMEVTLFISYAPVIKGRLTNEKITCDCNGVPAMYSVYRLDHDSENGKLIRSVNLNNESFPFKMEMFAYQKNGRYTCVVSNGIPDNNGKVLQTWSTYFKYEGSPVFAPENRNIIMGEVGQSITLSFYLYSYPKVEQVFVKKIGLNSIKSNEIQHYTISPSILRYTEYNNIKGIVGYEIVIDSKVLDIDDFQTYRITAANRLGRANYYFEILQVKETDNRQLSKRKPMYFMIVSSIATVIFLYMITIHICFCVKHRKTRSRRHQNEHEDQMYHTYDEVETNSYRAVRTMQPQDTSDNQGKNPTSQHAASSSNETNENTQSTDNSTNDLNVNSLNAGLPQNEVTGVQRQRQYMSTTSDETNFSNTDLSKIPSNVVLNVNCIVNCNTTDAYENAEPSIDTKSQTSNDSDSESSTNVMVGNFGDGYEQPYQTVSQTRPESHRYVEIVKERHTSISPTDSNKSEEQILQTGPTKKAVYTNLQL